MDFEYPLFFMAKEDLVENEKNKIRRHFQKKRDSGGGECGQVEKARGKLYKIRFKEEADRERVLQRKNHTIAFPSGELCLTVSRTPPEPEAEGSSSLTQIQPKPQPTKSPNESNRLEKTSPMDIHLMCYLRDCPKAFAILQKQFAGIGSILELDFHREVVTVRGDAEKGLSGAFSEVPEKWHLQVDRFLSLFREAFTCYHVVEPQKAAAILQYSGFADEYVKVYAQLGYPVVVGKESVVKERITNLERKLQIKTELSIDEKQHRLIEDEFTREMRANLPSVKIAKSNDVLLLEGLDAELQLSLAKYEDLLKKIQQKHVQFPTRLQNFFTTSGAIGKYRNRFLQSLRNPVALEAENSDLVLSSLSPDALEEAGAILKADFGFAVVQLQGNAAVPPDLDRIKEILMIGQANANARERRIDVNLVPQTNSTAKVQLVGYSETVNQLKEELHVYQLNHVTVQEVLSLPSAEMVDNFSKILALISPKDSKVTLKASPFPFPCVLLSGPHNLVQQTQSELNEELSNLISDTLVLDGPGARDYFSAEGTASRELVERSNQVFIQVLPEDKAEKPEIVTCPEPVSPPATADRRGSTEPEPSHDGGCGADRKTSLRKISLEIKLGSLVDEQVNVLVVPLLKKTLSVKLKIKFKFTPAMKRSLSPGAVVEVVAPASLGCSKLFFIECLPWDGLGGQSVKALGAGLKRCLELCEEQGYSSVALPVIGPGTELNYPLSEAVLLLSEIVKEFANKAAPSTVETMHIVIKPDEDKSEENYREVHRQLTQNQEQQQVIFKSVSSDLDDLSITVGSGVQLQLIFGDITNERTEAVVNSTNFENFAYNGVCKDILAVAGPEVEAELKSAKVEKGEVFVTQPGRFPCRGLLHVHGKQDAALVEQLVGSIVQYCEAYEWTSVAIPAICAGNGGLAPGVVAGALLRGLKEALTIPLLSLVKVRLVLKTIGAFLAFKEEATQMFSTAVIQRVTPPPRVRPPRPLPALPVSPRPPPPPPRPRIDLTSLDISTSNQQSVFKITGLSRNNISNAVRTMKDLYQSSCSSQTFKKEELAALTQGDLFTLKQSVVSLGLRVQNEQGDWTVCGQTAKVHQVMHLVHSFMYGRLTREVRMKEEEDLYARVMWCVQGTSGQWERLPKAANYLLEHKETEAGIVDAQGQQWDVHLQNMEVTKQFSTQKATLKRLENLPDFTFPLHWDNMASKEILKVLPLLPSSAEYQTVMEGFQLTCSNTVIKIERVQNIHLRRSYEAQLKRISDKNRLIGANERLLYHGTTRGNSKSILNAGFNSRFSGQNATSFGQGTYFAINANYSAHPIYSKPAPDKTQLMFLARVLTGLHTQGEKEMRVPPPRDPLHPHDRFDSVVDSMDRPNMYVVFHDNQAYPDYLITFKSS